MRVLLNEYTLKQHLMVGYFSWMGMATELISNQFRGSLGFYRLRASSMRPIFQSAHKVEQLCCEVMTHLSELLNERVLAFTLQG